MTITTLPPVDFGREGSGSDWKIINDGVMGGLSAGTVVLTDTTALFTGHISLANNGGFSSLRSPFAQMDLSNFSTVRIRYRSQGQPFSFILETSQIWFQPYYKYQFAGAEDDWQTVTMNLSEFRETRIGRETGKFLLQNQLANIIRIGFINGGKYESNFELEIDYIVFE